MTDIVERLRGYRAAAYPAHGSGFVGLFTGEGSALMLDAATAIETLTREKAALTEQLLHPDPDDEKDNLRLHREKCDALDRAYAAEARAEAAEKLVADAAEVIRPFAKGADAYDPDEGDDGANLWATEDRLTVGMLRAARAWTDKHDKIKVANK